MPDPATVEIIRNGFFSTARQMNNNLARSAYTPIIYEMKDCSVGVFDADANLLGQSPGLPLFLGNLEKGIEETTRTIGGASEYREGDIYLVNDPYITGSHTFDVVVFKPIFVDRQMRGFAATKAHWLDIGAVTAGRPADTRDIYQEGLRLGPTRVYRDGEPVREIIDLLMRNSRLPRSVWGDLHAQIAACNTGEQRMVALFQRFGAEVIYESRDAIFSQCERLDREVVLKMPDGVYAAEGAIDSDRRGGSPVHVAVRVTIEDDSITIDVGGSDGFQSGPVNCPAAAAVAGIRMAYKALVNPDVAVTGGTFRNLTVVIPEGSVFNARPPCATIYYASPVLLLIDLIMKAVSSAVPDRVVAGQPSSPATVGFSGSRADGSQYVTSEASALGWGGFAGGDGANAIVNYGAGDLKNHPIEVLESQYPLRVVQFALREDSGGKGEWRGGLGTVREYEVLEEGTSVSLWLERSANPGWGLLGGEEGVATKGEVQVGTKVSVELKVADLPLPRFARVRVMTGGGGGFGDPKKRSAEAIQRDLEDGYVRAPPQGE